MKKLLLLYCFVAFFSCELNLTKCEILDTQEIPPYKLVKKSCLGPAGPHYYPVALYKDSKYIGEQVWSRKDSCREGYQVANDLYVTIDACNKTFTEIRPDKTQLDLKDIDSIQLYSAFQKQTKKLSDKTAKRFVEDWNKSTAHGYRTDSVDLVFYPTYEYRLSVFSRAGKKDFLAFNYLITERTHWMYDISGKKKEGYFKKLWED